MTFIHLEIHTIWTLYSFFFRKDLGEWIWKENKDASSTASSEKCECFSDLTTDSHYLRLLCSKKSQTIRIYWIIVPRGNRGLGSHEPQVTFSSTNQYMTQFYVCPWLKHILFNIYCWLTNIEITANSIVTQVRMKFI